MAAHLIRSLLPLLAWLAAWPVCAQGLSDPTRPPRELLGGGLAESQLASPGNSPAQVIIISKNRRQATINGRTVNLGERYGNATLVGISDEQIVLRKPESTEVIRLYSSVNRRMRSSSEPSSTNADDSREDGTHETN
jgi:MSHA biogenesis protein MshK